MKKIGLVGGTGPESTLMYYKELNSRIDKLTGGSAMPDIAIESVDFRRAWNYVCNKEYDKLSDYLAEKVNNLIKVGCEVVSLTAVTMHVVLDEIESKMDLGARENLITSAENASTNVNSFTSGARDKLSLVSIPKAVSEELSSRGIKKVGLLGTIFTMEQDYMKKDLIDAGIQVFIPEKAERDLVAKRIFEELENGIVKESTLAEFVEIINKMVERNGIEGIILGCTELPLLLNSNNCPVACFDSVEIHIRKLIELAMDEKIETVNNQEIVKKQYATSGNLSRRISIHQKYSTNKMGFGNWIYSNYKIQNGMKILELGCGTGDMWKGHDDIIKACSKIVLSDFSEGMIETSKNTISQNVSEKSLAEKIEYKVIDIQEIPFEAESFDVVIANMMLYHVPDLEKGLSEVSRVLKKGGAFYCATYGEHGIVEFMAKVLNAYGVEDNVNKNFTLQNGKDFLQKHFSKVEKLEYKDSLAVTEIDDMVDYIYSLSSMTSLSSIPKSKITEVLSRHMVNGILSVPKEYGMFICTN